MGIGRQEFIRLSGLALVGLTMDPLKAVAVNDNFYVNKELGIICEKPNDWSFVSVSDYEKLLTNQIFPNEVENNKKELFEELGWSAVMITKFPDNIPQNKGRFSPTIMVDVNHKSEIKFKYENIRSFIEDSSHAASLMLRDFKRHSLIGPTPISGYDSYVLESTYLLEHVELKTPVTTNLKVVFIEHNNFYYIFNMHDTDEVNEQRVFKEFINKIKLI